MKRILGIWVFLAVLMGWPHPAHGILFDFDTLADDQSNGVVQTYMRNILKAINSSWSVTVSGSKSEKGYNGDNYAVGPVNGSSVHSETLGTSNHGVHHDGLDTFLLNHGSDRITLQFNFPIYNISFDYEIFPDATTPNWHNSNPSDSHWPDFTLKADGTVQFHTTGIAPGASGTLPHSPHSGAVNNELAPQFLGQSGFWVFPGGVTKLEFVDWPVAVGIDDFELNGQPPVPEPTSLLLFGAGLLSMLRFRARRGRLSYANPQSS